MEVEFLEYEATPEAKHMGIASIMVIGKILLKYKVVQNKDGAGFFVVAPSYKKEGEGEDKWGKWFSLDSTRVSDKITDLIKENVYQILSKEKIQEKPSVFNSTPTHSETTKNVYESKQDTFKDEDEGIPF